MTPADARRKAIAALLAQLGPDGHWRGELSSSALSTATAIVALATTDTAAYAPLIERGLQWLATHRHPDGGWGDTIRSKSNISTTALCWAAFGAAGADAAYPSEIAGAEQRLRQFCGWESGPLPPERLVAAIENRYGKDRTFSVPILLTCALAGRLGPRGWSFIPPLPFELAALPHQVFGALRLPVVSYALPALIAIGQAIHHRAPRRNPLIHTVRWLARARTLRVLAGIQPPNGGFLEATPLTSFVIMSLAAAGEGGHLVARRGLSFLAQAVREDGSWPIDTDLATWVTTLSLKALEHDPQALSPEQKLTLREWLLGQQYRVEHPYTHAPPGGWAWTNLPGGVPDADDTAGVLLALLQLGALTREVAQAGAAGLRWLLGLQNRDGGIPTFCRGWGALPFDRSSPDLTAHALRAWSAWLPHLPATERPALLRAISRGLAYLGRTQRADGAWVPLWFGNEHAERDENPLYGTAQVLVVLTELRDRGHVHPREWDARGIAWLIGQQRASGAWSAAPEGPTSIEETAIALRALAGSSETAACTRGLDWLREQIESGAWQEPSPIGFYFAKLWYFERLYPLLHTVDALGAYAALIPAG